jgi:hypothetical protein
MWGSSIGWGLAALGTLGSMAATNQYANAQKDQIDQLKQNETVGLSLRTQDRQRKLKQMVGQQAALYGASGVILDGTPGDVLASTTGEVQREQFNDNYNSEAKQRSWDLSRKAVGENASLKNTASLFNFGANAFIRG